jgi:hypothetical protein
MMEEFMDRDAVRIFLNLVMSYVYKDTKKAMRDILDSEKSVPTNDTQQVGLQKWFLSLDETQKETLSFAIDQAITRTIFNFLVLLDNKTTGYPLENMPSDFGIYLQIYNDDDAIYDYQPLEKLRVNMSYSEEDLHDAFMKMLYTR